MFDLLKKRFLCSSVHLVYVEQLFFVTTLTIVKVY